jgi:long-chain acyl-CoA synthetase
MEASTLLQNAQRVREQLISEGAPFELETVQHLGQTVRAYKKAFTSLPDLLNAGRTHGEREFIVYGDQRWTFNRFFTTVDALAGQLQHSHGLKAGDRVALAMRNCPEWAIAFAAVALVGAVPVPLNSFGLSEELSAALRSTQPRLFICDQARRNRVPDSALPVGCNAVVAEADNATWLQLTAAGGPAAITPVLAATDPALILFTSGATSQAKGVLSNQRAVCQALHNIDFIGAISAMTSPEAVQKMVSAGLMPTTLTAVPLFHVSGLHAQLLASLRHGRRLVFMHRWDPSRALELIQTEKITQFNGAPSMVQQLLNQPAFHDHSVSGTLMGLGFGGAGLSQKLIESTLAARPQSLSGVGFGLTETNGVGSAASGQLFAAYPHCSGLVSPLMEIRVVDANGQTQTDGQEGEVWLRGVTVMDSYWGQTDATHSSVTDGWFHTGDVGLIDNNGLLRIVDRIKDVINRNGEKISAAEIESCLLHHPEVDEAAVFAQADEQTGEAVVAVVHLRMGSVCTETELQQHVAQHLAAYKVPKTIHFRSEAMPRNPAGKLLKNALKKDYLH